MESTTVFYCAAVTLAHLSASIPIKFAFDHNKQLHAIIIGVCAIVSIERHLSLIFFPHLTTVLVDIDRSVTAFTFAYFVRAFNVTCPQRTKELFRVTKKVMIIEAVSTFLSFILYTSTPSLLWCIASGVGHIHIFLLMRYLQMFIYTTQ
jgi:hypothetical protein